MPGDVIFTLKTKPHSVFSRVGDTLFTSLSIELEDALLGFRKRIKHLDDHYTEVESFKPV